MTLLVSWNEEPTCIPTRQPKPTEKDFYDSSYMYNLDREDSTITS